MLWEVTSDAGLVIGPLGSPATARKVAEAIESVVPLRRCTNRIGAHPSKAGPCAPAQLGVSTCPCTGEVAEADYQRHVDAVVDAVTRRPAALFEPLEAHMHHLAAQERFEEAALARDRLEALVGALHRRRQVDKVLACDRLVLRLEGGERVELRRGVLWTVWPAPAPPAAAASDRAAHGEVGLWPGRPEASGSRPVEMRPDELPEPGRAVPKALAEELLCVAAWLERHSHRVRLEWVDGTFASPLPALPRYAPRPTARLAPLPCL